MLNIRWNMRTKNEMLNNPFFEFTTIDPLTRAGDNTALRKMGASPFDIYSMKHIISICVGCDEPAPLLFMGNIIENTLGLHQGLLQEDLRGLGRYIVDLARALAKKDERKIVHISSRIDSALRDAAQCRALGL